jgi:flavin-dependent dehydrogenase
MRALQLAGIKVPDEIIEQSISRAELMGPDKIPFHIHTPDFFGYMTRRDRFDAHLTNKATGAGAHFIDDCELKNLKFHSSAIHCLTNQGEYKAHFVVGADGVTTKVGRFAGLQKPMKADEVGIALEVTAPISDRMLKTNLDPSMIYLWFLDVPFGYFWVFPRKDSLSLGVGGMAGSLRRVPALLKGFIRLFQKRKGLPPLRLEKIRGHMLPVFALKKTGFTGDRILLTGDAAGFVDTFTGQGICYAIESGLIAGHILKKIFKDNLDFAQGAKEYEQLIQRRMGRELLYSGFLAQLNQAYRYGVFRVARHLRSTSKFIFDIATGNNSYDRIRRNPLKFLGKTVAFELLHRFSGRH